MGEWLETPKCWKWRSFTKVTIPVVVRRNSSYGELVASVLQSGNLDCVPSDVVISYLMNSREKVNPTIIISDVRVLMYMMDVDTDSFRPILRINVAKSDYENDDDQPINMKDNHMHMEEVSSDSQDDEDDRGMRSQPGHSFNNGANFHLDQIFTDKKELKMLLDAAASCTPWTLHGYLAENLRVNQHCGKYRYLFYAAAKAYTVDEFSEHFVELKNNSPEAIHVLENVLGFEKWSRAHFSGNRYDVITTNIVESLNSVLMDEREYPVSYIFNSIARKFSEKFRERHAFVDGQNNIFMPCAERILKDNKSASDSLYVTNTNGGLDQFTVFGSGITATVNFLERSCSGKKFNLVKISCEHAMAALRAKYGDGVGYGNSIYKYSSLIYKA
ncbi:hypothetical protein T459_09461 [Capsicum annuum]|uniref:Zinc finger PMZ-type domain-containing protein n=1 Tax=Capsicum annuum TaxID=4072 RepID=A0A2G2ZZF3_CAPAN|nr:hypothetical protein T459_09461 [Capsicum annuum]